MGLFFSIPPGLHENSLFEAVTRSFVGVVFVLIVAWGLRKTLVPVILDFLSKRAHNSQELFLLGTVSLAMILAIFTEMIGLSLDFGACALTDLN